MAADLRTRAHVNLLLPGGATVTGMMPVDAAPEGQGFLEPAIMGPPIVWWFRRGDRRTRRAHHRGRIRGLAGRRREKAERG